MGPCLLAPFSISLQCRRFSGSFLLQYVIRFQTNPFNTRFRHGEEQHVVPGVCPSQPYPSQVNSVQCKYSPPPRSPNLAQINFGPWDLHSVIFPDPPLCLLIPLTANLITDGQEIQKSSWEEILLTEPKKSLFTLEKKIYFWPNIPQGWRQVAVTDWIQIWCK